MGIRWRSAAGLTAALFLTCPPFAAAEDLAPDVLLVAHTQQANRKLLTELKRYTCLETISRSQASAKHRKAEKQDVIRLDVGIGEHEEIYSWPGDATFSSKDLFTLVGHGLLANGLFQAFAANLFLQNVAVVKAAGQTVMDGKKAYHFTFNLPSLQHTRWDVNWLGARGSAGEEGEFWVDQSDLTLMELNVAAVDISPNVPLQSLTVALHYRLLSSGAEQQVLIPETALLKAVEQNGTLHQEAAEFSHCRSFEAESSLSASVTEPEDLPKEVSRYEAKRELLPGGVTFPVSLETPVHAGSTMVGEPIVAVLDSAVRPPGRDAIPKGALLKGRIRELERLESPPNTFMVGVEFDELTWPGHSAAFFAGLSSLQPIAVVTTEVPEEREQFNGVGVLGSHKTVEIIHPVAIPGVASFFLRGAVTLPKGFRMTWRTQDVARH